jgi:hypothetical protein
MGTRDPRVDAYIARSAPFAQPILAHIRAVVHQACPRVEETVKWGMPAFDYHGLMCGMAAFKQHCAFNLWKASLLKDALGATSGEAMGQFGRITSEKDLPPRARFVALVKKAAALNEAGVTRPREPKAARPPLRVPPEFMAALKKNKKALATFDAFSPSHKREYVEWVAGAKTDATREKRLATAVAQMADGKSQNWKYERPRPDSKN